MAGVYLRLCLVISLPFILFSTLFSLVHMLFKWLRNVAFTVNFFLYTISGARSGYYVYVYITFIVLLVAFY